MEAYRLLVFFWVFLVAIEIPDGAMATEKIIVTAPTTSEACYDVLGRDCFRYKDTDCVGPFETWARANCSLRCGYCPQKLQCVDNLPYCYEFGKDTCHQEQYGQYMREHCRKFCNFCRAPTEYLVSSTVPTTTSEPTTTTTAFNSVSEWCRDNMTLNCWYYPDEKCGGTYEGWARVNCPYRCGYCPNYLPPCVDLDSNCNAFRNGSCTDTRYRAYMREHCRRHCNECHYPGQTLTPISPPPTIDINTGASPVNTVPTKEASEWCKDNSTLNCWYYPDEKCVGAYEGWARVYCPYRCGYCPNFYPPCEDLDSNCAAFTNGSCTDTRYRAYMREHCRRHCNECHYPGQNLTPNSPPLNTGASTVNTVATKEACYDVLGRDCFRYKDTDCVGPFETWARANCSLRCGYCPQKLPCVDDLDYCNEFGKDVCNHEQYGQYMREHCRKFCNFCKAPTEYLVSSTLPTTTPEPTTTTTAYSPASEWCRDNSTLNCWYYPDEKCVGAYEGWARVYCPYRCGYCPNFHPPCEDLDSNCAAFTNGSCTDTRYRAYMREHCRSHCNECYYPGQDLTPVSPPTPVFISTTPATSTTVNIPSMGPSGGPPAVEPTLATAGPGSSTTLVLPIVEVSEWCRDNSTLNCWYYPDEKCVGAYESWARVYCPYRCGYCPSLLPPCQDLDVNCKAYVDGLCTNTTYRAYMREHCRKHCNECYYPGQDLMPNTPPSTQFFTVNTVLPNGEVSKSTSSSPPVSQSTSTSTPGSTEHLVFITLTTSTSGLACPECDTNLNCVWNRSCSSGEVCMLLQYHNDPLTVHCSKKQDCIFMKTNMQDAVIKCCEDHQCVHNFIP